MVYTLILWMGRKIMTRLDYTMRSCLKKMHYNSAISVFWELMVILKLKPLFPSYRLKSLTLFLDRALDRSNRLFHGVIHTPRHTANGSE